MTNTASDTRTPVDQQAESAMLETALLADCELAVRQVLLYGDANNADALARVVSSLDRVIGSSRAESENPLLSERSLGAAVQFREQIARVVELVEHADDLPRLASATEGLMRLGGDFLWLPEIGQHRQSLEPAALRRVEMPGRVGLEEAGVRVDREFVPTYYQLYIPEMERLTAALLAKRSEFDMCVVTGRSGVGMGELLNSAGIRTVELPPLRIQDGDWAENRPAVPVALEVLREQIAGKRVVFVDDQIGGGTTLHYARLLTQEFQGTFVGAALYRSKSVGDACQFLLPNEFEVDSGMRGTSDGTSVRQYPTIAAVFGAGQRANPF